MAQRVKKPLTKRGRPALKPAQRKRKNVTMRLRDEMKEHLQKNADASGRSLSEEIETRLERSLHGEDVLAQFFGGTDKKLFMLLAIQMLDRVQRGTGAEDLWSDLTALDEVDRAFSLFFDIVKQNVPGYTRGEIEAPRRLAWVVDMAQSFLTLMLEGRTRFVAAVVWIEEER